MSCVFCVGDGNVSFEEFVSILVNIGAAQECTDEAQEEQELRDAFRVFDKHNRGYICASDLRAVLQCLGEDLSEEESKFCKYIYEKYVIIENFINNN